MCSVCYGAGRGKAGDAYVFALQKAKERILAGNLLHGLYRKAPSGPKPVKEDKSGKEKVVAASPRKPIKCQDSHLQEAVIQSHPDRMQQLEALLSETVAPQTCIPITLRLIVEISVRVNGIMA
jgi:hypothetical protein